MKKIHRYPGAKPFETSENHIFYGRKEDAEELYQRIRLNPLVLLHAKSGMGKSSLINAGLVPLMKQEGQFSITSVRFNARTAPTDQMPLDNTRLAVKSQSDLLDKIRPAGDDSLWYQLKSRQINGQNGQQQLLIFDQFEELFTYEETAIRAFASELSEALYSNLPQRFRELRKAGFAENPAFLNDEELAQLDEPPNLHILLSIRSDRMSLLKKIEAYLPNILSKDYELQALERTQAEDAILSPAYLPQSKGFLTPVFDYTDEAIEYLLDFLSEKEQQPIESFQLQILCEFVENILVEQQQKTLIEQTDIANPDQILENYYLDKIKEITNPEERLAARRLIEEGLIFEEEERRLTLYEGQIVNVYHITPALLNKLLDTHLIRSEPSLRGGYTYELSHDTLVAPVLKAKAKRLEQERIAREAIEKEQRASALKIAQEKLEIERKRTEAEKELRKQAERAEDTAKSSARTAKRRLRVALLVGLIALALAGFAYFQSGKAKLAEAQAKKQTQTALANDLAYKAQNLLKDGDRTKALQFGAFAHRYIDSTNHQIQQAIHDAFYYNDLAQSQKGATHLKSWYRSFNGHLDNVYVVNFSPDGKYLISGCRDNSIKLWSVESGAAIRIFEGHTSSVNAVNFSPDGKYIVSASSDKTLKIWSVKSGEAIKTFTGHTEMVEAVNFSPDGQYLISGGADATLKLWSIEADSAMQTFEGHTSSVNAVNFSPDGKYLISGSADETLKLWAIESGTAIKTFKGHQDKVYAASFSPDGQSIISGSKDNSIKQWSVATGKEIQTFAGHADDVFTVNFSPDGQYLVSGSKDNTLRMWSVATGEILKICRGHASSIMAASFSPDGQSIVSGSADNTIRLWLVDSQIEIKTLQGHTDYIYAVEFSPDGKYIASGSRDQTLKLWSATTGQLIKTFTGHLDEVTAVDFSPDGQTILSGSLDNTIRLWSVKDGTGIKVFKGHDEPVETVSFSSDGKYFISGSRDHTLKLWSVKDGTIIKTFTGHNDFVKTASFSPDGKYIISGSLDSTVKLWSIKSGKVLKTFSGHSAAVETVNFSPDSKFIISGSLDNTIKMWSITSETEVKTFEGHASSVEVAHFSPDGKTIISGSWGNTLKLWSVKSGTEIKTLEGHASSVYAADFSPDGKRVVSGSLDHTLKLWQIKSHDMLHSVPQLAHFSATDIRLYRLYDILTQFNKWDNFLATANPIQVFTFGQFFQKNVQHLNNPIHYNPQLAKAVQCYEITAKAYPFYRRYVADCYLEWGEKLLKYGDLAEAKKKVELAGAVAPADLREAVEDLRRRIAEKG